MDRLKRFFKESRTKKNFKKAGPGRRLADSAPVSSNYRPGPSAQASREQHASYESAEHIASADMAAQAAYKRMNLGAKQETTAQRNIRLKAMRELENERQQQGSGIRNPDEASSEEKALATHVIDERNFEHSGAIQGVYFTCELLGDEVQLTRSEMRENVEAFLRSQLDCDAVVASSLMIFSLNGEKSQVTSETLQKYLQNLIEHPEDPKYRRIRMSNKAFQERVGAAKGGVEFLLACGFEESLEAAPEGSSPEKFLVISEEKADDVAQLVQALEVLRTGEPVPLKLYRDPTVFKASSSRKITVPELSSDFFQVTAAEVKKEQASKTLEAERMLTLRTQEMRLRDETLRHYTYKYTLIRIRFPDDFFLQGTFSCHEKIQAVRDFICEHLVEKELPLFILKDPTTGKVVDDDKRTLGDLNLAPAAMLNFEWDPDVLASYVAQGIKALYLDDRCTSEAKSLK